MKKVNWVFVATILTFFLSACVYPAKQAQTPVVEIVELTCESINLQPAILGAENPLDPGVEVIISVQPAVLDVTLDWKAENGHIVEIGDDTLTAVYVAPTGTDKDTVTVSDQNTGCSAPLDIIILAVPTATIIPSATPTNPTPTTPPTATETPRATQIDEPSPTPTETATASPTPLPPTKAPTNTPTPAPITLIKGEVRNNSMYFEWFWPGVLAPDMHFAVRVGSINSPEPKSRYWTVHGVDGVTGTFVYNQIFVAENTEYPPGSYPWHIALIRDLPPLTSSGEDPSWEELARSETRTIIVPPVEDPPDL